MTKANKALAADAKGRAAEARRYTPKLMGSFIIMKIYDRKNKIILNSVTLYLTPNEAAELAFDANDLSENPQKHHSHITDKNLKTEIIISVYTKDNIDQFDEESKRIIDHDSE